MNKEQQLQEELNWCYEGLTNAHTVINPTIPVPDWHRIFLALKDMDNGNFDNIDQISKELGFNLNE